MRPRLLIVDDDRAVLLTYAMILRQEGYETTACGTLSEAHRTIDAGIWQLVLCDLTIEHGRGGFEVIAHARRRAPGVPAILLTGLTNAEIAREAQENNIVLVLKPVEVLELLRLVARLAGPGVRQAG